MHLVHATGVRCPDIDHGSIHVDEVESCCRQISETRQSDPVEAFVAEPMALELVHSVNAGEKPNAPGMTIDDVSARRAISAISSQPVNAPPIRRSRNGSHASTVLCPKARGFCTAKNSLVSFTGDRAQRESMPGRKDRGD